MVIMPTKNNRKQGFSLIQISMLIAVSGIILASVLPAGEMGSDIEKERITQKKMEKIEEATQAFMMGNLRRPCPADGTLTIGDANFGKEDPNPGSCSGANFFNMTTPLTMTATTTSGSAIVNIGGGSDLNYVQLGMLVTGTDIADNSHVFKIMTSTQMILDKPAATSGTNTITFRSLAAGVVPVRSLGLSDDYMLDGYGRRITYVVDTRATDQTTCRDMATTKSPGLITVKDNYNYVMWTLISHGRNGHGAFPAQGSSVANRINSGSTSTDERINAFVDASFNPTFGLDSTGAGTSYGTFIAQSAPAYPTSISSSDDIVWYNEKTKNTCCTGKICHMATALDASPTNGTGYFLKTGDINGDGISDIILSSSAVNPIRVIFGSPTGWNPQDNMTMSSANDSRFISITNNSSHTAFGASMAVGDLNGDGYDDIAIGYRDASHSYIKVFYGSANPVSTNSSAITNVITFPTTTDSSAPEIMVGNFANTNKKDLLVLITTASGTGNSSAYVIYGASSYSLTAEAVTTVASTNGFKITTTSPGRLQNITSTVTLYSGTEQSAGDINGDGYDDIIISNYSDSILYVLFGQSQTNWNSDITTAATGSTPDIINIDTRVSAGGTEAVKFNNISASTGYYAASIAEMNGDNFNDLIFRSGNFLYIYYGKSGSSWSNVDINDINNYNGTNGFRFDISTNKPSWLFTRSVFPSDINSDKKTDLIFIDSLADPNSNANSGASFVALQPNAGWNSIWSSGTISLFGQIFNSTGTGLPLNNNVNKGFVVLGENTADLSIIRAIADIDNDGKKDFIIAAPTFAAGIEGPFFDKIGIFFGRSTIPWDPVTNVGYGLLP